MKTPNITDRMRKLWATAPLGTRHPLKFGFYRMSYESPAPVMTRDSRDTGLFHPNECRKLTVVEIKRIFSFPDQFRLAPDKVNDIYMDKDNPLKLSEYARRLWDETPEAARYHHRMKFHMKVKRDEPGNTLTKSCGENVGLFHPVEPRRVSAEELRRIASFPSAFRFTGEYGDAVDQIGNCVPPLLMRAVADELAGTRRRHEGAFMKRLLGTSLRDVSKTYVRDLDAAWADHLAPRRKNAPTVVSLFAGCGGSSLGYSMAGYRELLAVEWDAKACATFRLNFPDVPVHEGDIALLTNRKLGSITGLKPGELDVLDGSPPCQGFSTAGKRMIDDPRNQLFREYVRILRYLRPKKLVMENVTGMVKGEMIHTFHEIMRELRSCGYEVRSRVLNAMHYGVPQARQRVIFVGSRVGEPTFPEPWSEPITVRDAWAGLDFATGAMMVTAGNERHTKAGRTRPWTLDNPSPTLLASGNHVIEPTPHFTTAKPGSKTRRALDRTKEGGTLDGFAVSRRRASGCVAPTLQTGGAAPGQPGSSWPSHPTEPRGISLEEAQRIASFPDQFMFIAPKPGTKAHAALAKAGDGGRMDYGIAERLAMDETAGTLRTGEGHPCSSWFSHPTEMRGISLQEAKRIGSFPDQFGFGDWRAGCRQIGNCVPPLLMRSIADALKAHRQTGATSDRQRARCAELRPDGSHPKWFNLSRLMWGAVAPTLMKGFALFTTAGLYHPDEPRLLTVGEYARIASFPDLFMFIETWKDAVAQMGNSVPPPSSCAPWPSLCAWPYNPRMLELHRRFIDTLPDVAARSDDPDTQTAAVLSLPDGSSLSSANALPDGVPRTDARISRPDKYDWIMHAERRVLMDAARAGKRTDGSTMYLNWFPCAECAQALVHAGVSRLFASRKQYEARISDPRYKFAASMEMLTEADVSIEWF